MAPDILAAYSDLDRLVWYQNNFDYTPIPGEKGPETPEQFGLTQNYPNPFNPTTKIGFKLPQVSEVTLTVYNVLGQKVSTLVDRRIKSGRHTVTFDGSSLSSGVYTYRLKAGNFTETRKMLLIK